MLSAETFDRQPGHPATRAHKDPACVVAGGAVDLCTEDTIDIGQVIEQYHSACHAFAKGDPAPVKSLYAHSDDVLLANPFGGSSRGWKAVSQALDFASSNFREGKPIRFEEVSRYTGADLVTLFEREIWETRVGARTELTPFELRVTSTFRLEVGSWKLVSRHADPLTTAHPDGPLRSSS